MTRPDSDQSYDTESGLAAQNDISEEDLISFLDQGLDTAYHQRTGVEIGGSQGFGPQRLRT